MQRHCATFVLLLRLLVVGSDTTGAAASRLHGRHLVAAANCLAGAKGTPLSSAHLQQLKHASRVVPASHIAPASDWPEGRQANEQDALHNYGRCIAPGQQLHSTWGMRYKILNRTILVEPGHEAHFPAEGYRHVLEHMLRIATWLYEAFPDVDLFVNFADTPTGCPLDIPWLQYSVLQPPGKGTHEHMQEYVAQEFLPGYKADPSRNNMVNGTGYTRGYTIPLIDAWTQLALSKEQLRIYLECLQRAVPWSEKANTVFWRGSTTGLARGWRTSSWRAWKERVHHSPNYLQQAVMNKRSLLALMSYPYYPDLNIAIGHFHHNELGPNATVEDRAGAKLLESLIGGGGVPMHDWGAHKFTVNVDGHGPAFRLPMQLLSGTAILMMDTPYATEFAPAFQPHKHYVPFAYDLGDWLQVALSSVRQARNESAPFRQMAQDAASVAASRFSMLGQLDTLMMSIRGVKRHSPWPVTKNLENINDWQPLQAPHLQDWGPPALTRDVMDQIVDFIWTSNGHT